MLSSRLLSLLSLCILATASDPRGPPWQHHFPTPDLLVEAPSGTYRGLLNGSAPHVREFLGIPFAQPPTAARRWLPPQKLSNNGSHVYDATRYPPSCPQFVSQVPSVWNDANTNYIIAGPVAEDCLALSVWTPVWAERLPVVMFVTGGGFQTGGVEINYQLPYNWVQRTQGHVVVTINYRVNIFGFPNAAGLEEQNLGLLDQRAALEWVRDNIEAFGGDPSHITLWGQSAGAASTDYQNFAFYDDPIVTGFFGQSGTALLPITSEDSSHSNFTFVARNVGCNHQDDGAAELECMRKVPWDVIENFVGGYADNGTVPALGFNPVPDDKVVFSNYTARYEAGKVSQRPAIFSTTQNEGVSLVEYHRSGVNQTAADQLTLTSFLCPAAETSKLRTAAGLTTYRYLYAGNFSNVSPLDWMGAYHASDLPMMFATHQDYSNGEGPSTALEFAVSERMEDLVLAFMVDPEDGPRSHGWEPYESGKMLEFGADGKVMREVGVESVEGVCS